MAVVVEANEGKYAGDNDDDVNGDAAVELIFEAVAAKAVVAPVAVMLPPSNEELSKFAEGFKEEPLYGRVLTALEVKCIRRDK